MATGKGIRAGRAYVELGINDKLTAGLKRMSRRLKAFGAGVRQVGMRVAALGGAMTAALLGAAKVFSSMGDEVAKMAKRTGMSVEALSELRFVASQTGIEFAAFEKGIKTMQRSIYDLGRGLSTQVDAFADLGLAFEDLDGLSPEQQFKMIAEAMSKIEDPTRRAAIAASLLGRAGTRLLPMFLDGAAGIERLQKEARRLGLTMSREDAKAAELLTDQMDALGKTIKMGIFRIGAALAPILGDLADKMSDVVAMATKWISRNRGLIVTALKVSATVLGIGVALISLGAIISGLGSIFGLLATTVTAAGTAVGIFGSILAAVVSPIGLAITAVAGLGAVIVHATDVGGKALAWLGEKFGFLKDDALAAYRGIGDALVAGDLGLAADIMWLTLKKAWLTGIEPLSKAWSDLWHKMKTVQEQAIHRMTVTWLGVSNIWSKGVSKVEEAVALIKIEAKAAAETVKAIAAKIESPSIDLDYKLVRIEDRAKKARKAIASETDAAIDAADERHKYATEAAGDLHKLNMGILKDEHKAKLNAIDDEITAAEKAHKAAIAEAAKNRKAREADGGPGRMKDLEDILDNVGAGMDAIQKRTIGAKGTFNASAILSLQAGGPAERTAKAADQIVKHTKKIVDNTKTPMAFA